MRSSFLFLIIFSLAITFNLTAQEDSVEKKKPERLISGFIRAGFYGNINQTDDKPYLSSVFSDAGISIKAGNDLNYSAFTDLRFRYGTEFLEPVTRFDIREAFVSLYGEKWNINAGQKIVKWGRADFTNPTSKLSPQDLISRSPDREDINLANLLVSAKWYPVTSLSLEAVAVPFYRPSRLLVDPIELPFYITLEQIESMLTNREMFSYALKTEIHVRGADMSLSWFDGYDPMPGTALTSFEPDLSGTFPIPYTRLTMTPYKIRNIGADFETALGPLGFRGEASYMLPYKSWKSFEYVPLPETKWVAGIDWSTGTWRFTGEYSGKAIQDFIEPGVIPLIGSEPDMNEIITLMATPGFNMEDYVRQQVGAFNRLYNYQMKKVYHSAALRIETELFYGKLIPSFLTLYNFTSRDLLISPELVFAPADGIKICLAGDYLSGKKGSLYDIADNFMNCIRVSIRVDY